MMDEYITKSSPVAVAIPLLSFVTLMLDIPSFAWHIKNRNLSASCLVFWVVLNNLFTCINSIIWHNDNVVTWWHGEIYCDIQIKLFGAGTLGLTGAVAVLMRNLAMALDTEKMVLMANPAQRQRKLILDCVLCFGLPLYMIIIHYVVQPFRYYIFAIAGCVPSIANSWPSIVLVYIWPPILCLLDAYYCGKSFNP